jgi:hypothetical protein
MSFATVFFSVSFIPLRILYHNSFPGHLITDLYEEKGLILFS